MFLQVIETTPSGSEDVRYEVLNIIDFSSSRKRMSVIVRDSHGSIFLFCKVCSGDLKCLERMFSRHDYPNLTPSLSRLMPQGADIVIRQRMDMNIAQNKLYWEPTAKHMEEYGNAGLRTLCLAYSKLTPAFYDEWVKGGSFLQCLM